ncbi:nuclear transport factor 2 family protein [Pseudomonas saliphila]|uniref:nuclear transport factor 2 family protein n=1 Tax=Pseudomonas saliphila TaxID=2586906 RepID=UPI0012388C0C|nr:nuclear transport factor 2 family protein [Pseudomonas saliphila]
MNNEERLSGTTAVEGATSGVARAPLDVVHAYTFEFWNRQNFDIADEIIADEMTRHVVGARPTVLTREQAKERARGLAKEYAHWAFRLIHAIADGEKVCTVYESVGTKLDGSLSRLSSIEVFHVVEGRIVAVWNNAVQKGLWDEL